MGMFDVVEQYRGFVPKEKGILPFRYLRRKRFPVFAANRNTFRRAPIGNNYLSMLVLGRFDESSIRSKDT